MKKTLFLLLAGCLVLAGCKRKESAPQLNLFAWSEYIPQAVLDGFTAETGIKVNYETYSSGEEMLSKLLAGAIAYDLIQPSDYIAEALIADGQLVALDAAQLPHWKNIAQEYRGMPHDPQDAYTVPFMIGTVGIVTNTEKIAKPATSYAELFAPANKGRVVVVDDGRELVTAALYTLGGSINDITPENVAKTRPVLSRWFSTIKLFDSDSPKTALLNGDVDLGLVWSGEAALLWNENQKFAYALPAEGAHMFVDLLAIPKTAKNVEAAHKFIDYILRPEVSRLISEDFPYTNPNLEARKLLTEEQLANPASYPKVDRKLDTFRHIGDSGAIIDQVMTDLKNAK